ncbi:MAG TPA: PadR family transcriptional regulator [Armatimonadota bacterium]|jgi:DNA-binding PadR family transcriptional regulator
MASSTELGISPVETVILSLLDERMMYGYEIIKVVNERTDGAFAWKEGTLYPCLHRLEGAGIIVSDWQPGPFGKPRKYYQLTHKGHALARTRSAEWRAFSGAMDAILFSPAV